MTDSRERKSALLFSPFFHPENISSGRYNTHLALALAQSGSDVAAVCSYPFYPDWKVSRETVDELPGIQIVRGGKRVRYPRVQVLRRIILEVWYFFFTRRAIRSLDEGRFDVIVDIYPPNLFSLGSSRKRRINVPVVGIVHDLQGVMSQSKSSFFRQVVGKLIRPIERRSLQNCDRLIFLSKATMEFGLANYELDSRKCHVVYPFQSLPERHSGKIPSVLSAHKKSLVYSGALSEKQSPEELFQLMNEFARRHDDYAVIIFSDGPVFESLKERCSSSRSLVKFHGLVPDDELDGLLRASTIQIIPQKLLISHGAFPSKLPNLIAAETAIFGITDEGSEVDFMLSKYSQGRSINTWQAEITIQALDDFAREVDSGILDPSNGVNDRELRDLFSIEALCEKIWDAV